MSNMNEKSMTPVEIERATVERCAKELNKLDYWYSAAVIRALPPMFGEEAAKDAEVVTHPMQLILDARRRRFLELNGYELKYLPVYADQPDPTYIEKWVWEVRDEHGAAVAEAHEWLYAAIDAAMAAAPEVK